MLEVAGLNQRFGLRRVLEAVEFTVPKGVCAVLFGTNGAGKTTLLKLMGSLLPLSRYPNRPTVKIDGFNLLDEPSEARARLGYLGHHPGHYRELTAVENLRFVAQLYRLVSIEERIRWVLERVKLTARANEPVGNFSAGMAQRLALARVLLHQPTTLLLDEPFAGLDPGSATDLEQILGELKSNGCSIVLATHAIERGLSLADKVFVLAANRLQTHPQAAELTIQDVVKLTRGGS